VRTKNGTQGADGEAKKPEPGRRRLNKGWSRRPAFRRPDLACGNTVLHHYLMFEWDDEKSAANRRNHGVSSEDILPIFNRSDREGLVVEDKRKDYAEDHFILLCPFMGKFFHVTFTWREDHIRLISARRANWREVQDYERRKHH